MDYPYELVNNLTTNDATKGLTAAMGVTLEGEVSQLEAKVDEKLDAVAEEFPEFIRVYTDSERKILWAIKADGGIYFGAGVPEQVKDHITEQLAGKVDIVAGKSLIDENVADSVYNLMSEIYLQVTTDEDGRILEGIRVDGTKEINTNVKYLNREDYLIDSDDYLQVTTDNDGKILEGTKIDGTKVINTDIEYINRKDNLAEVGDYLQVTTDNEGRIIEGIKKNGEKHISSFDKETKDALGATDVESIPLLDNAFTTSLPCKVYLNGVEDSTAKGDENAKYVFSLSVSDTWIVRFKFRITENLLNQNKDAVIAKMGDVEIFAKVFPLLQHQETYTYEGVEHTENWPTTDGGIAFNQSTLDNFVYGRNLGQQAFSVRYIGSGSIVTLENTGSALLLVVDGTTTTYNFSSYNNMSELFAALSNNPVLETQYIALDRRTCDELAKFGPVRLKDTFYTDTRGVGGLSELAPHEDAAPFYLYYAVSEKWHQAEIFKRGSYIYSICDGIVKTYNATQGDSELTLGGECGVLFKDFVFADNTNLDTEYINGFPLSSVTPYILLFVEHGMFDGPTYTITAQTTDDGMSSLTPDTLDYFYTFLDKKGYIPVTIDDVAEYCTSGKPLPKRSYVHIFDDAQWQIAFNLHFRSVLLRHGAKPTLAMVTAYPGDIYYNGEIITKEKAVGIAKNAGYSLVSHTALHRNIPRSCKPSQYIEFFDKDIRDGDERLMDASVLVYPGGDSNVYSHDVMEYLGFRIGIEVVYRNNITNLAHTRFNLSRVDIGRLLSATGVPVNYEMYISRIV